MVHEMSERAKQSESKKEVAHDKVRYVSKRGACMAGMHAEQHGIPKALTWHARTGWRGVVDVF